MVGQPLERAGHPLARAAKGWYHPFPVKEMKKFPGLVAAPGSHAKPAGNVKAAVLHRLERVLSESGVQPGAPLLRSPRCPPLSRARAGAGHRGRGARGCALAVCPRRGRPGAGSRRWPSACTRYQSS